MHNQNGRTGPGLGHRDTDNASALAALGVPAFACTPDTFPELIAVAIEDGDVTAWAHRSDVAKR